MNTRLLIPLVGGMAACTPAFVGEWDISSFSTGDYTVRTESGTLTLSPDDEADLELEFIGDSPVLLTTEGDLSADDDEVKLDMEGFMRFERDPGEEDEIYTTTVEMDCVVDGDTIACDGDYFQPADVTYSLQFVGER